MHKISFRTMSLWTDLLIFWIFSTTTRTQTVCNRDADPCSPGYPCVVNSEMSNPSNCETYQRCLAPYEYAILGDDCGSTKGAYSNVTCQCNTLFRCEEWECPKPITPTFPESEPCMSTPVECSLPNEGQNIPDRFYCSKYFRCTGGAWMSISCPSGQYYHPEYANEPIPCIDNTSGCRQVPYEDCFDFTTMPKSRTSTKIKTTATMPPITTELPITTEPMTNMPTTNLVPTTATPPTTTISPKTTTTVPLTGGLPCAPNVTHCSKFVIGATVADRTCCGSYYECLSDRTWIQRECPSNMYYNPSACLHHVPCVMDIDVCLSCSGCQFELPEAVLYHDKN